MQNTWVKPTFEEVGISGECTAYAGAARAGEAGRRPEDPRTRLVSPSFTLPARPRHVEAAACASAS